MVILGGGGVFHMGEVPLYQGGNIAGALNTLNLDKQHQPAAARFEALQGYLAHKNSPLRRTLQ